MKLLLLYNILQVQDSDVDNDPAPFTLQASVIFKIVKNKKQTKHFSIDYLQKTTYTCNALFTLLYYNTISNFNITIFFYNTFLFNSFYQVTHNNKTTVKNKQF